MKYKIGSLAVSSTSKYILKSIKGNFARLSNKHETESIWLLDYVYQFIQPFPDYVWLKTDIQIKLVPVEYFWKNEELWIKVEKNSFNIKCVRADYVDLGFNYRREVVNLELDQLDLAVNDLRGMKYSSDKVPLYTVLKQFREAFIEIAKRSKFGHEKYAEFDSDWRNFERLPNADEEYGNAQLRHLLEYGEDTKLEHYVATAWNAIARLQVYLNEEYQQKK